MNSTRDPEERRLKEVARYRMVGSRREPEFDGLCALARQVTGATGASVGLLDRDRVWIKASIGHCEPALPRAGSFSDVAIAAEDLFALEDAHADPRFGAFRFEDGTPVRAVLGVPLEVRRGIRVGTLCVFFAEPRLPGEAETKALRAVAAAVVDRLRLSRILHERRLESARERDRNAELAAQRVEIARQRRLQDQTSRLARVGGWEYDVRRRHLTWSDEIYRILELDRGFVPVYDEIGRFYREDHRGRIIGLMRGALQDGQSFEAEAPVITQHGRQRWVRFICEAETARGLVVRLIGTVQDVTDLRATEERVTFIATHDVMTRLPNRAVLNVRLAEALGRATSDDRLVGLILIDIDHFKTVNDTLGHHAGDALLTAVGARLVRVMGGGRVVARLGGDEFAVLAPETAGETEMMELAGLMMRELLAPVPYGDESIPVTVSAGITIGRSTDTAETLLKDADIALYEAKGTGRNRAVLFDRSMRDEIELRQSILRAFRQAIERDELLLHYQPKISLRTGELYGFEALLRWRRPDGFVAGPSFFGPALEDPQISQTVGDFVLQLAVRQAAAWRGAGHRFGPIAINTATSQYRRGDFAERVIRTLHAEGVPPEALMIEVTENVLLSREAGDVHSTLQTLHQHGVKIALDDFGTGYASLTHLKEFPVDLLKIDRSFVSTLGEQRESRAIVRGITALAHDLGIEVIAEGIETVPQRDTLRHLGVNYGQGYYFARPVPPDAAADGWLAPRAGDRAVS